MRSRLLEFCSSVARNVPPCGIACNALRARFQNTCFNWPSSASAKSGSSRQLFDDALIRADLRTVSHQCKRLVQQIADVNSRLRSASVAGRN